MHIFEFGVTTFIDWRDVETVYVKAESSSDAIKFMHTLTDEDDENKPYADFKFRTFIPECCLPVDAEILDSTESPSFVLIISEEEQEFDWLEWYSVCMNGKIIGDIGQNRSVQENYYFSAYEGSYCDRARLNMDFSGSFDTLEKAKTRAYEYAEYLNKEN
jgi:hypothetical protein